MAATVLIAVALVPAIARAHDRFDHQRTPQQEHSRFRWANSCAAVPQKATTFVVVVPAEGPAQTLVDFPLRLAHRAPAADVPSPDSSRLATAYAFRAPPAHLA
ncbi:MAG TPA: hypothetical protein VKD69_00745 [Vicinamibacterales bacterium]|nr:hypothetical protein [Vicinamibacterales bacterium]